MSPAEIEERIQTLSRRREAIMRQLSRLADSFGGLFDPDRDRLRRELSSLTQQIDGLYMALRAERCRRLYAGRVVRR